MKHLSEKSLLVRMHRKLYQPYAYDAEATTLIEESNGVSQAGRFNKRLLRHSSLLKQVMQAYGRVYSAHMDMTLPWLDDGMRLLPSAQYMDYTATMRALTREADEVTRVLESRWEEEIDNDRKRLGSLFRREDYPKSIRDRFAVHTQFFPVPTAGDFRVEISEDDKRNLDEAIRQAEDKVKEHIVASLIEPLQRAASKLSTPIGEDGHVFRDSLLQNVLDVAQRMRQLDITDDPRIGALIEEVSSMGERYSSQLPSIRRVPEVRKSAATHVQEIIDNLKGVF